MKATTTTNSRRYQSLLLSSFIFTITSALLTLHPIHHHERQVQQQSSPTVFTTVMYSFQQQNDEEEQQQQQQQQKQEYRPISDYVGGLHGGKYVFDDRISGITALNYETSILVFDYPSDNDDNDDGDDSLRRQKIAPPPEGGDNKPPNWARRKLDPKAFDDAPLFLDYDEPGKTTSVVQVVNEELSWEPFWASVETSSGGGQYTSRFTVSPNCGTLAPRGGSNDFSDCCRFALQRALNHQHQENEKEDHQTYLVVRTEQDYWIWRLCNNQQAP